MNSKVVDDAKRSRWLKAMLHAYYTIGVCADFFEPDPKSYSKTYLAMKLVTESEIILGLERFVPGWQTINTNNLIEAQSYIHGSSRWYIHCLDDGTFTSEKTDQWTEQGNFSMMLRRVDGLDND